MKDKFEFDANGSPIHPLEEVLREVEAAGYNAIAHMQICRYEFDRSADFEEWSNCSHE